MLYDDMMALDMRLGFKVNESFGSLANFKNSDISDMKPSTVISSVNTRSLLLEMFSFKFLCKFVFDFLVHSRFFKCSIHGTLSVPAPRLRLFLR